MTETIYPDEAPDEVEKLIQAIAPGQTVETIDWTQVVYPDQTPNYLDGNPRSDVKYIPPLKPTEVPDYDPVVDLI